MVLNKQTNGNTQNLLTPCKVIQRNVDNLQQYFASMRHKYWLNFDDFIFVLASLASMTDFWNIKERKAKANYSTNKVNIVVWYSRSRLVTESLLCLVVHLRNTQTGHTKWLDVFTFKDNKQIQYKIRKFENATC